MALSVLPWRERLGVGPGRLLIDGRWVDGADGRTWTHVHPHRARRSRPSRSRPPPTSTGPCRRLHGA